jgi:predicted metal-binding membrane protein
MTAAAASSVAVPVPRPARTAGWWLVGLAVAAWVVLVAWALSSAAGSLDHERLEHPDLVRVGLLVLGWALMTLAMMGPATVGYVRRLVGSRGDGARLVVALVAFLATWVAFGLLVTLSDLLLHKAFDEPALAGAGWVVLPATFLLAATYQLTGWKRRALARCSGPTAAVAEHWAHGSRRAGWWVGVRHGVDCVGSCAGLMLAVFALGMTSLLAMAFGTVAVLLERRSAALAVPAVAAVLVVAAAVVGVHPTAG